MLWFVGLGISGIDGISSNALNIIKKADIVFLENFTSPIGKQEVSRIRKLSKKKLKIASRWMVEDGKAILLACKGKTVVHMEIHM